MERTRTSIEQGPISRLVLASSSPRRKELIKSLGLSLPVHTMSTETDETVDADWTPREIVELLSLRKAGEAARMLDQEGTDELSLIVSADTIVVVDGEVLGKPENEEHAVQMLRRLQGKTHQVFTGLACLLSTADISDELMTECRLKCREQSPASSGVRGLRPEAVAAHAESAVTFLPMSDEEIRGYVATGEPLDKAGAYGVQGLGSIFVERIEGDFYSIMGLPLNLLYRMLLQFGISPFKGS